MCELRDLNRLDELSLQELHSLLEACRINVDSAADILSILKRLHAVLKESSPDTDNAVRSPRADNAPRLDFVRRAMSYDEEFLLGDLVDCLSKMVCVLLCCGFSSRGNYFALKTWSLGTNPSNSRPYISCVSCASPCSMMIEFLLGGWTIACRRRYDVVCESTLVSLKNLAIRDI